MPQCAFHHENYKRRQIHIIYLTTVALREGSAPMAQHRITCATKKTFHPLLVSPFEQVASIKCGISDFKGQQKHYASIQSHEGFPLV